MGLTQSTVAKTFMDSIYGDYRAANQMLGYVPDTSIYACNATLLCADGVIVQIHPLIAKALSGFCLSALEWQARRASAALTSASQSVASTPTATTHASTASTYASTASTHVMARNEISINVQSKIVHWLLEWVYPADTGSAESISLACIAGEHPVEDAQMFVDILDAIEYLEVKKYDAEILHGIACDLSAEDYSATIDHLISEDPTPVRREVLAVYARVVNKRLRSLTTPAAIKYGKFAQQAAALPEAHYRYIISEFLSGRLSLNKTPSDAYYWYGVLRSWMTLLYSKSTDSLVDEVINAIIDVLADDRVNQLTYERAVQTVVESIDTTNTTHVERGVAALAALCAAHELLDENTRLQVDEEGITTSINISCNKSDSYAAREKLTLMGDMIGDKNRLIRVLQDAKGYKYPIDIIVRVSARVRERLGSLAPAKKRAPASAAAAEQVEDKIEFHSFPQRTW